MLCFGNRARREEAAQLAPLVYESSEGREASERKVETSLHTIPIFYADLSKQYRKLMNPTR